MGGSQKSKRVTWASDVNLCQVRLFLSEESPSQVGLGTQDHLQAKALWPAQAGGMGPDDNLPPGFEGIQPANPWTVKLSQVPLVKWRCPPRFEIDGAWRVVAGEESKETEIENEREMRVLEAIYPRPSAIPPNPCASVDAENSGNQDQYTPVVPITPIEDEDATPDSPPSNGTTDMVAAAQAALSSVMSNSGQGSLIDRDLLIKILSDPKMIEQLATNHSSSQQQGVPAVGSKTFASSSTPSTSTPYIPNLRSPSAAAFDPAMNRRDPLPPANAPFYPPNRIPNQRPEVMMSAPSPSVVTKDFNYLKNLIQQHGEERRENVPQYGHQSHQEPLNTMTMKPKPKIMKPCIYFNSSRGCRNGANCTYQHDVMAPQKVSNNNNTNTMPEVQASKRVKLDREITGS